MEEEAPELISPRISFSHDLANFAAPPRRSDASLLASSSSRRLSEPEFDFANANAAAADVAPADRLFAGGRLLPMPPLPPAPRPPPSPCKQAEVVIGGGGAKVAQQACPQKRPGSWASPFSRSSSVNSATTTAGAPRYAGRFGCPPFPLMRSRSASAAVARDGSGGLGGAVPVPDAAGHRPRYYYKKSGGTVAPPATSNGGGGGTSRAYYYGGSGRGSGNHGGVRVSPVLNVTFIGTSMANVLSYLLCDCSSSTKTKKSREFASF